MSKIKAKKKRKTPIDPKEKKYSYEDVKDLAKKLAVEMAKDQAVAMYRQMATEHGMRVAEMIVQISCIILNDTFGFGGKRIATYLGEINKYSFDFGDGLFSEEDVHEVCGKLYAKAEKYIERKENESNTETDHRLAERA